MFAPGPEENHPRRSARPLERRNKEFVWRCNKTALQPLTAMAF
jgi:hypothetical protein